MSQRHIILIGFILPGAVGALIGKWNPALLGMFPTGLPQAALQIYLLLIGVFAGFEIRGFFLPAAVSPRQSRPGPSGRRGPFERQYREAIYSRYRDLLATGVQNQQNTLEQEHIFEPPLLTLTSSPSTSATVEQGEEAAPKSIWQHLAISRPRLLLDLFRPERSHRHFVILGMPGGGKSTLLQHIALTFARRLYLTFDQPIRELTPILLVLRDHLDAIKANPQADIAHLITSYARSRLDLAAASIGWFTTRLRDGRCIVLLDGLDEIADAQDRKLMAAWVQAQLARWHSNYVVITSRPHGYVNNPLDGVRVLSVEPFIALQIESFVRKWYLATEIKSTQRDDDGVRRRARENADDLIVRMTHKHDLSNLASNPLLLTMIATVHRYLLKLPEKRAELYKEIFEVFLGRRQKVEDGLVVLQKLRVLGPLAYRMMHRRDPQIGESEAIEVIAEPLADVSLQERPAEFLKRIEESSGLLLEIAPGVYKFAHLTYQEYLASVYVLRQHLESELTTYVDDTWWHETILLAAAQEDASEVLEAALGYAGQSERALSLGITILEEAISLRPEVRARFVAYMEDHVEQGTPEQRTLIADALLRYNLRQMAMLDERKQRTISGVLISHPAYQRFLDIQRAQGRHFYPDYWLGYEFPSGHSKQPVLGVRLNDAIAFCAWLSERDRDGMRYRLPTVDESKSYQAGLDSRQRYWVADGGEHIYGERWATPQDRVRAILAEHLFDDMYVLQIFALGLLVEQVRDDVRELSNWHRHALALPDEIATARRIDELGGVMSALTQAIVRMGREATRGLAAELSRVALTIQDKARLAVERYTHAQDAAVASHESKDEARAMAFGKLTDELRGEAREPVRMIGDLLKLIREDLVQLNAAMPPALREGTMASVRLHEVTSQSVTAVIRALALPAQAVQGDMLAEVREHLYLTDISRLPELARAGYTCLDVTHAVDLAQVFDRAGLGRPARAREERVFLRYWALLNCLIWVSRGSSERGEWTRDQRTQGMRIGRRIYIDLVLLDERIAGRMPPVEGIRLVREPRDL